MPTGREIMESPGWEPPDPRYRREAESYLVYASLFALDPEMLGECVEIADVTYRIVGFLPRARLRPLVATDVNGRAVKLPLTSIPRLESAR